MLTSSSSSVRGESLILPGEFFRNALSRRNGPIGRRGELKLATSFVVRRSQVCMPPAVQCITGVRLVTVGAALGPSRYHSLSALLPSHSSCARITTGSSSTGHEVAALGTQGCRIVSPTGTDTPAVSLSVQKLISSELPVPFAGCRRRRRRLVLHCSFRSNSPISLAPSRTLNCCSSTRVCVAPLFSSADKV